MQILELIHFVHDDEQLVVDTAQRILENLQRLAGRSGLVRIEEDDHEIGLFGKPADGTGKVVAPSPLGLGFIDHSWAVDQRDSAQKIGLPPLQTDMADQLISEMTQAFIGQVRIADDRRPVPICALRAPGDDREAVICRRNAGFLHFRPEKVVDEGRLAGRVISKQQDLRRPAKLPIVGGWRNMNCFETGSSGSL